MVRRTLIILCMLVQTSMLNAAGPVRQMGDDVFTGYKGILRFQGTFAFGYNTAFKSLNYFLQGDVEYYFDERWSFRSDIYYFLNSRTPNDVVEPFKYQHALHSGVEYHLLQGRLDWYVGLQPGFVFAQRQYAQIMDLEGTVNPLEPPQKAMAPVFSVNTGINYYANKLFHLFLQMRYNAGWFSDNYSVAGLSEIRASFGLGFYFRVKTNKGLPTG